MKHSEYLRDQPDKLTAPRKKIERLQDLLATNWAGKNIRTVVRVEDTEKNHWGWVAYWD